MLKQLFEFVRQALYLQRDIHDLKANVSELERGLEQTNEALRQLAIEFERLNQHVTYEHEKLKLQLENALLRFERRLPPGGPSR